MRVLAFMVSFAAMTASAGRANAQVAVSPNTTTEMSPTRQVRPGPLRAPARRRHRSRVPAEIAAGTGGYWAGFAIGAAIGTPIGLVVGALLPERCTTFCLSGIGTLVGGGIGMGIGGLVGGLIGAPIAVSRAGRERGGTGGLGWSMLGSFAVTIAGAGLFGGLAYILPHSPSDSTLTIVMVGLAAVAGLTAPVAGSVLGYELSSDDPPPSGEPARAAQGSVTIAPTVSANGEGALVGIAGTF